MAYLRFASVYRAFTSIEDIEAEIRALRTADVPIRSAGPGPQHHDPFRELEPAP